MKQDNGPTAWVLAGGGSLGAVQVGMLRALVAAGHRPDMILGTSVGAINAAYFAGQPDTQGLDGLSRLWAELRREDIFPVQLWQSLRVLLGRQNHLVSSTSLARLIRRVLPIKRLEHAVIPLHVMATDLATGQAVRLSDGPADAALLASAAIPAVFPAVPWQSQTLMDGAVSNNTPIREAVALGARRVVVLPTGMACNSHDKAQSAWGMVLHAVNLMIVHQLLRDVTHYEPKAEIVIVPPLCPLTVNVFDFSQGAELIERAHLSTALWLQHGGLSSTAIPDSLRPHHHPQGDGMDQTASHLHH